MQITPGLVTDYIIPIISFLVPSIISIVALIVARKKSPSEEKIKGYILEQLEQARAAAEVSYIEAEVVKFGRHDFKLRVFNSGHAPAFDVDFSVPAEIKGFFIKTVTPYEQLDAGKHFDERVIVYDSFPPKVKITTFWKDKNGTNHSNEQVVQVS